ncbi:MAG TPA: hypothetical protein ENI97_05995 [Gammaproteobacteria bacterium]|nr:hypothetical protein [Gammaproteobacteria bacterium]
MGLFNRQSAHPRRSILTVVLISTGLLALSACKHDEDDAMATQAMYQVTVYNLTNGQPLTPLGVVIHGAAYSPWQLGSTASVGLETLAESGDPTAFLAEADANTAVMASTSSSNGPFGPGASESVTLSVDHSSLLQLSVASMLANTNDAFTGVSHWEIGRLAVGESVSTMSHVFDAGTEANTESSATMPGPAAGGEGFNATRDDLDKVTIHRGVVTADDGLTSSALDESHRWLGYAAKVVVTRMQ